MASAAVLSPAVPKPAHVPDSVVYDFDMFLDPAYVASPHERILDLHKKAPPIFWTPRQGGHWMLLSHDANFKASRDWESFSNQFMSKEKLAAVIASLPKDAPHIPQTVPIGLDPPDHAVYRAPLQGAFSPKAALALRDDIRALANQLIDKIIDKGRCEFMTSVAEPLPVQVFLKLLGLPLERQAEYRALVKSHLASLASDTGTAMVKLQQISAIMRDTIIERRDNPRDDIISLLWQTKIDGKPTTMDDLENYTVLLFIAGLDTVMNGMGYGIRHLAMDLPLQEKLRKNPDLISDAKEELLRRYTFTVPPRYIAKDIEFEGVSMREGERVMLFLPAADLDAKEFPNPERFDLQRDNVHIAFNSGPHRCLGSHLARMELQVLYEQMLSRLPPFRLDPKHPPKFHGGNVVGVDELHIVWEV